MSGFQPAVFAREWVAAWNRADVAAILAHYSDDVLFISPLAGKLTGDPQVRGKVALGAYWTKALRSRSLLPQFLLESFVWDCERRVLLIVYVSTEPYGAAHRCEWMHFRPDGLIDRGEAFAGASIGSPAGGE